MAVDPQAIIEALGMVLADVRHRAGLSLEAAARRMQRQLGEEAVTSRSIGAYERAQRELSTRRLLELCDLYGVYAPRVLLDAIQLAGAPPHCPTCGRP